jgi:LmbE family N-acetylglucosaminyl deacetylase
MSDRRPRGSSSGQAGAMLPAWPRALVVIAHPDDESFGLGAVIDRLTVAGAEVRIVCYTHTGVTGHPDHRAATGAAVLAGRQAGTLPMAVAARLSADTGQDFAGQPPDLIDLRVRVSRRRQRRAALLHASQISPGSVLWRRLQLLGDREYLRWLVPPAAATTTQDAR